MKIELAKEKDKEEIFKLYKSVLNTPYSTWNEFYPSINNVEFDLKNGSIYVLKDDNNIIGAVSCTDEDKEDNCWKYVDEKSIYLTRLCISTKYQGRGLAKKLVCEVENILRERGFKIIHLTATDTNIVTCNMYKKLNYIETGSYLNFNLNFICFEKILSDKS